VLGPSTIELYPLFLGERDCSLTLCVGKAFPKSHCKFGSIAGRKLQQLGKRVWFHVVILSREVSCHNWAGALPHGLTTEHGSTTSRFAGAVRLVDSAV